MKCDVCMYAKYRSKRAYVALKYVIRNLPVLVHKLECGDADSAGSTLRSIGIVILVLLIVTLVGVSVANSAGLLASTINQVGH
jgi:hypothetical protein